MALWQYTFYVLPKNSVQNISPDYRFEVEDESFDDSTFWRFEKVNKGSFHELNFFLPKGKSWSNKIDLYGNQESNCFEVSFENDIAISVSFRIDFTSNYEGILRQLIEFFIVRGLIVVDESLNVVPLNFEAMKNVIENSSQVKTYNKLSNNQ